MAHLWLQNANEAEARKCARLNRSQLAPASRVDAQIAIHVESGTTCRSSACFGPAKRPRNNGRRAIRGMQCVARRRRSAVGGRRSAVGGRRPAGGGRRAASRLFEDSVSGRLLSGTGPLVVIFSFNLKTLPNFAPPGEIRGYKLKGILKYISQN